MNLTKAPIEYTSEERAEIYASLYREERAGIKPFPGSSRITGGQISAAKGRATRRFFAMGF